MQSQSASILVPANRGTPFEGGFYGGTIVSHGGLKTVAVVWAPKAAGETTGIWLPSRKPVAGATSCWHSMDNTRAMAEAGSPIAQWALSREIGGYTDWCIPARDVLEIGYRWLKPTAQKNECTFRDGDNPSSLPAGYPYTPVDPSQTLVEAFREGGAEAFEADWYWSSTQCSGGAAWYQGFYHGFQLSLGKEFEGCVRLVRLIPLTA